MLLLGALLALPVASKLPADGSDRLAYEQNTIEVVRQIARSVVAVRVMAESGHTSSRGDRAGR